jgi:hypothetical protein
MLMTVGKTTEALLTTKVIQPIHRWSKQRWGSLIQITPAVTPEEPLWKRDEESLAEIQLCGLSPQELHAELETYWQKPFWRRWLQRLLSPIQQREAVWSYYQQCLVFRELQKDTASRMFAPTSAKSQAIMECLAVWLNKADIQFEQHLSKQTVPWLTQHFTKALRNYEQHCEKKFFSRLDKEVRKITEEEGSLYFRIEVKREIAVAYQEIAQFRGTYLSLWQKTLRSPKSLYERPLAIKEVAENAEGATVNPIAEDGDLSQFNVDAWVEQGKQELEERLTLGVASSRLLALLLKEKQQDLFKIIDQHLACYQRTLEKVRFGVMGCQEGLECVADLQSNILHYYRKAAFLFHPDHNQTLFQKKPSLWRPWNEVFQDYRQHWGNSLKKLEHGREQLQHYIGRRTQGNTKIDNKQFCEILLQMQAEFKKDWQDLHSEIKELTSSWVKIRKDLASLSEECTILTEEYRVLIKESQTFLKEFKERDARSKAERAAFAKACKERDERFNTEFAAFEKECEEDEARFQAKEVAHQKELQEIRASAKLKKSMITPFGVSQQGMPTVPMINRSDSHITENGSANEAYRTGFFTHTHMPTRRLSMESVVITEKMAFQYPP